MKAFSYFIQPRYWLRDLILSSGVLMALFLFLFQPVQVIGTSMLPQLRDDQRLLINKIVYKYGSVGRGDVVVFHFPEDPSMSYIKRVIGLPGERLEIRGGRVYVNGDPLAEEYLSSAFLASRRYGPVKVPPGHFFVLGDHRGASRDSRQWGTLEKTYIFGKAVFRYWPFEDMGSVR